MKNIKRFLGIVLSVVTIAACFAGCSGSTKADEITDKTMLIAYTEENKPFIYEEDGKLTGFDVEIIDAIFNNVKNDYKNYKFVKVDEDYKVGEDAAYTAENGTEYIAYIMVGGIQKNNGSFNKDNTFTEDIISNRIITLTQKDSKIKNYANLEKADIGVFTKQAMTALEKNSAIKSNAKGIKEYKDIKSALKDLDSGKIDALITDEFSFNVLDTKDNYSVLPSELDTISYVYSFKKYDWYVDSINQAIMELQSPDYNDADEFTPIVEKYFGYNASSFEYNPVN